jgi:hypothetical protein
MNTTTVTCSGRCAAPGAATSACSSRPRQALTTGSQRRPPRSPTAASPSCSSTWPSPTLGRPRRPPAGHRLVDVGASLGVGTGVSQLGRSRPARPRMRLYGGNYPRLRAIKAHYDPSAVFGPAANASPIRRCCRCITEPLSRSVSAWSPDPHSSQASARSRCTSSDRWLFQVRGGLSLRAVVWCPAPG